jgi:hypothetical protein
VKIKKVVQKKLDHDADGVRVAGTVNAVISASINEPGTSATSVSSRQRIVQRKGKTTVEEETKGEVE